MAGIESSNNKKCAFCDSNSNYCCPRCGLNYCNLQCYKHRDHENCSEAFYKDWIVTSLKDFDDEGDQTESKQKMFDILKRLKQQQDEVDEDDELDSDDETLCSHLESKILNLNINSETDPDKLWDSLTIDEQNRIKNILDSCSSDVLDLVPVWEPWWSKPELVTELDGSKIPEIATNIKPIHQLTSGKPSPSIGYNIVNILAIYAYSARRYNGEFCAESCEYLLSSQSLISHCDYGTVLEPFLAVNDVSKEEMVVVMKDVELILKHGFALAALSDLRRILIKHNSARPKLKNLNIAVKRLEFLLSWVMSVEEVIIKLVGEIKFEIASQVEQNVTFKTTVTESTEITGEKDEEKVNCKLLIEEIK